MKYKKVRKQHRFSLLVSLSLHFTLLSVFLFLNYHVEIPGNTSEKYPIVTYFAKNINEWNIANKIAVRQSYDSTDAKKSVSTPQQLTVKSLTNDTVKISSKKQPGKPESSNVAKITAHLSKKLLDTPAYSQAEHNSIHQNTSISKHNNITIYQNSNLRHFQESAILLSNSELIALLHAAIADKQTYPLVAQKLGQKGTVKVAFRLFTDGSIDQLRVLSSSKIQNLDAAALQSVMHAAPFAIAKHYIIQPQEFIIDIVYE